MSEQLIRLVCPALTCRKLLAVPMSLRGRTIRCCNCGTVVKVPKPAAAAPAPPAPAEAPAKK